MHVIQCDSNAETMLRMYSLVTMGHEIKVRGAIIRNVPNLAVVLYTSSPIITSFKARKFNLQYAKREWLWYLGADKFDDSIEQYATMWKKLKQTDGSYYSNYGQYIFAPDERFPDRPTQFEYVINTLKNDPHSRRASIVLLKRDHLHEENSDVVCTYAINFFINPYMVLDMTVMMRSNDVIFGFTNDAFCFWNLYEFVFETLHEHFPQLARGMYTHFVNSMHVYDRHYEMIEAIVRGGMDEYEPVKVPKTNALEVSKLVHNRGKGDYGDYSAWLQA